MALREIRTGRNMAPREFQDSVRKFISVHPDCIYGLESGSQSKSINFWNGLRTGKRLLNPVRNSKLLFTCENEISCFSHVEVWKKLRVKMGFSDFHT